MNQGRLFSRVSLVGLAVLVFTGCSLMQPIHSRPPVTKIVLRQPFDAEGFGFHLHMPAGDYLPAYEEGSIYYYQAPSQLSIRTIATQDVNGGFYVDARTKSLVGWWYFEDGDNGRDTGRIDGSVPGLRMIP